MALWRGKGVRGMVSRREHCIVVCSGGEERFSREVGARFAVLVGTRCGGAGVCSGARLRSILVDTPIRASSCCCGHLIVPQPPFSEPMERKKLWLPR